MAFIRCPECGAENNELAPTCFRCGYPLKNNQAYGYQNDFQAVTTEPIGTEPLYQEYQQAPAQAEGKKGLDLKLLLVMILGGVTLSLCLVWSISRMSRYLPLMFIYILGDGAMLCAMFFQTLKKKVVAIILAAAGILFAMLLPLGYFLALGPSFVFMLNTTTVLSMVLSVLFAVLLLLYTLMGEKHGESIVWMLVFIGLAVFNRVMNTGIDLFTLFMSLVMAAYYVIGYSPAKWYNRIR